jgi:hypothetical protein
MILLMAKPLNTVAYTGGFLAQAKGEGMTEGEMEEMEKFLAANPEAGNLIVGSGGCRKVRISGKGKGKSGGYRVVTYFATEATPVYLVAMLAKGSRENFSDDEVAAMAEFSRRIKARLAPRAAS